MIPSTRFRFSSIWAAPDLGEGGKEYSTIFAFCSPRWMAPSDDDLLGRRRSEEHAGVVRKALAVVMAYWSTGARQWAHRIKKQRGRTAMDGWYFLFVLSDLRTKLTC
jgi:hypothetical protein